MSALTLRNFFHKPVHVSRLSAYVFVGREKFLSAGTKKSTNQIFGPVDVSGTHLVDLSADKLKCEQRNKVTFSLLYICSCMHSSKRIGQLLEPQWALLSSSVLLVLLHLCILYTFMSK